MRPRWPLVAAMAAALLAVAVAWVVAPTGEGAHAGQALLHTVDLQVATWLQAAAKPGLTRALLWLTDLHDPIALTFVGAAFGAWLWWRRQPRWLLALIAILPTGMLVNLLLKQIFQRPRPLSHEPLLSLATYSFPSGHVVATTLFYGVLAAYGMAATPSRSRRALLLAGAVLMVLAVAATRIYLGVHYFSDTLAAAAWATAWVLSGLALVGPGAPRAHAGLR